MRALLGILGLAAIALLVVHELDRPQPTVLIDFPISNNPLDDLNLNEGNG